MGSPWGEHISPLLLILPHAEPATARTLQGRQVYAPPYNPEPSKTLRCTPAPP